MSRPPSSRTSSAGPVRFLVHVLRPSFDEADALAAAFDAAEELVKFVVADEEEPDAQLLEAFLMAEILRGRWRMWRALAGSRLKDSRYEYELSEEDTTSEALAARLGLSEGLVEETLP